LTLFEGFLVTRAQRHQRLHVDLIECRQQRLGRLRFYQALCNARAQARHRHALFNTACGGCGLTAFQMLRDVALADPAVATRARDPARRQLVFLDQASGRRRQLAGPFLLLRNRGRRRHGSRGRAFLRIRGLLWFGLRR